VNPMDLEGSGSGLLQKNLREMTREMDRLQDLKIRIGENIRVLGEIQTFYGGQLARELARDGNGIDWKDQGKEHVEGLCKGLADAIRQLKEIERQVVILDDSSKNTEKLVRSKNIIIVTSS
jgi:hypothetical protein